MGLNGEVPPKSPLPPRHGLQAAWVRTPDRDPGNALPWPTMRDFLFDKLGPGRDDVDAMLERGEFVDDRGRPWSGREVYRPHRDAAVRTIRFFTRPGGPFRPLLGFLPG